MERHSNFLCLISKWLLKKIALKSYCNRKTHKFLLKIWDILFFLCWKSAEIRWTNLIIFNNLKRNVVVDHQNKWLSIWFSVLLVPKHSSALCNWPTYVLCDFLNNMPCLFSSAIMCILQCTILCIYRVQCIYIKSKM